MFNTRHLLAAIISLALLPTAQANYLKNPEVSNFIRELSEDSKITEARLKELFGQISPQQSVLEKISRPAEKTLEWKSYRPIFLKQDRIEQGVAFMREHSDLLKKAELQYGVPPEIITAIIGVETKYGRITGNHPVFASVATLAFDYPPRSRFFRKELSEFLQFAEEENFDPLELKGSYAGAMGMAQFISSSYRRYAVDFDGDGKRDLWHSTADAIGSVANYFMEHRWQPGEAVVERVTDKTERVRDLAQEELKPAVSRQTLDARGLQLDGKSSGDLRVFTLNGAKGEELWIGHHNFYVITRYNHSELYAMAVFDLSREILAAADAQ